MKEYMKHGLSLINKHGKSHKAAAEMVKEIYGMSETVNAIRKRISRENIRQKNQALLQECEKIGIDVNSVSSYWHKGKHFSIMAKGNSQPTYEELRDEIISEMKEYAPHYPKISRDKVKDGHLLVVDPADVHIGKLAKAIEGEEYNTSIAVKRVKEGVQGLLDKSVGFNIDQILFIGGNDILHIDSPKRTTTSGTPQDTDGMWYEAFLSAKKLYIDCIEMLLAVAPVHFTFNPSNHDYISGFMLADVISSWFRNCEDITFDTSIRHRKYYTYGTNLIATSHGDSAKHSDLPLLMAHEAKADWAKTDHRYVYLHHVHHKTSKDFIGVTCESLRSPSGSDSWHSRKGYIGSPKAVEGFIHHKKHGQCARLTHLF
jgi:hypothetical protein